MSVSIRSRLLLLVVSALLPALAAALWLIAQTFGAERAAHERSLRDTARALARVVDRELAQRATVARMLTLSSNLDAAPALDGANLALFEQQARRAMVGIDGWVELSDGRQVLLDTRKPPLPQAARQAVLALVDAPAVGPMGSGGGVLHAAIVYPVQRQGRPVLSLSVSILPAELQRIVDEQGLPPDRFGTVIDNGGTVVARHPGGAAFVGRAVTPDLKGHLKARSEGLFESIALDGTPSLGYFSTSPQGWVYVSAMQRPELIGSVPPAVLKVAAGALLLLVLAGAGALWVARRIGQPVVALKEAAARMKAGVPLARRPTGITECDEVVAALAEAGSSIQRGRSELESQVADAVARTRAAEQRVAHSQRLEALGRLTGGVAHDFNNLLGVISNSAHVIQRRAEATDLDLPMAAMLRAIEGGSRLTEHLQRIAGHRALRPQPLDPGSHLPELKELLASVLSQRIVLDVRVAPGTRSIFVDPNELELALLNLALNARDAMPGGGHVWLHARNADEDEDDIAGLPAGQYVIVSFADDGSGMDPGLTRRAFEPFFTTKVVGKGTGLGLSQVHGFCVQARGAARLGSTPGLGTTVSLVLPASNLVAAEMPPADVAAPELAGVRVLLVEDNAELATVTAALLSSYGCSVEVTERADDALQRLQREPDVDVVLSDIVMPGKIDGLGLARLLRQQFPRLPVVLTCGYSDALTSARDFIVLRKPCEAATLLETLQSVTAAAART
jgi:signal transduction histidine kinase